MFIGNIPYWCKMSSLNDLGQRLSPIYCCSLNPLSHITIVSGKIHSWMYSSFLELNRAHKWNLKMFQTMLFIQKQTLRVIKPPERFSASVWWIAHESSRFSLLILPTHCFYLVRKEKRKEKEEEKGKKKKKKKTSVVLKQLHFSRMLLEHLSFVRENDKLMKEFHKSEVWCVRPVRCVPCFWISWMNVGCGFRFLAMATISRIMNAAPLVLVWGVRNTLTIVCVVSLPKGPPRQWWKPC